MKVEEKMYHPNIIFSYKLYVNLKTYSKTTNIVRR